MQPNMGLLDIYSAVNAGRVGRYNASDANNGGAPGTVADKVNYQMGGHRKKAEALLGRNWTPPAASAGPSRAPQLGVPQTPMAFGDFVAPQPPQAAAPVSDFGSVVANYLQQRDSRQAEAELEQARRQALFAAVPSPFG